MTLSHKERYRKKGEKRVKKYWQSRDPECIVKGKQNLAKANLKHLFLFNNPVIDFCRTSKVKVHNEVFDFGSGVLLFKVIILSFISALWF